MEIQDKVVVLVGALRGRVVNVLHRYCDSVVIDAGVFGSWSYALHDVDSNN